jgi:hypothetical protein
VSFIDTICPSKLTYLSSELSQLNWHLIYLILVILSLKPFDSKICLHDSSFWSILIQLSSISTTSSAVPKKISFYVFYDLILTKVKIYEFNIDPWCNLILVENTLDSSSYALTLVIIFVYISLIRVTYFIETLFFLSAHHMKFLSILSCIFSKLIDIICMSFFHSDISV